MIPPCLAPHPALARAVAIIALSTLVSAHAEDALVTDRPDISESSEVVGKGRVQLETSFSQERNAANGLRTRLSTTPTLLRLGLSDSVELRIETDGRSRLRTENTANGTVMIDSGMADAALGLKWHTQDGDEATGSPSVAWLLHADLASGSGPFRGQGVRPSLRVVGEWELPDEWSVGVMPGIFMDRNDLGQRYWAGLVAVTLGKEFSANFRGYVEFAAEQIASQRNGGNSVSVDGGVAYLLSPQLQLDFSVKRGISHVAPDSSWALGLSAKY